MICEIIFFHLIVSKIELIYAFAFPNFEIEKSGFNRDYNDIVDFVPDLLHLKAIKELLFILTTSHLDEISLCYG